MSRVSVILFAVLVAPSAEAQPTAGRATDNAEHVARMFLDAMAMERWLDAAQYLNLAPLERQRRRIMRDYRQPRRVFELTVDELMKLDSTMPRAVAEYQVARNRQEAAEFDESEFLSYTFADVRDTVTLLRLSPLELGATWVQAQDTRYEFKRAVKRDPNCAPVADSLLAALMPRRAVLGSVRVADTAYVLHRDTTPTRRRDEMMPIGGPMLLTLHRRGSEWRIEPSDMRQAGSVHVTCRSGVNVPPL